MQITIHKYHGAGNDFILIDNREDQHSLNTETIARMCERRYGIGADGLMILDNSEDYDFRMQYYNSDGNEGSMCGNGGRCIVAFAYNLGIIKDKTTFIAVDGVHYAEINNSENDSFDVSLNMNDVRKIENIGDTYFIDTGSPHHIEFVDDVSKTDIFNKGKKIRYSQKYRSINGTNVNFIEINKDILKIRTYERGVEDETHACGTGATAAAIAYAHYIKRYCKEIKLQALGGTLRVKFDFDDGIFHNIVLSGPVKRIFTAKYK